MKNRMDKFIELCRERGLRITPQRLAIYEAIAGSMEHPSTEMVYNEVHKRYPTISFATVYKTLETLREIGAVVQIAPIKGGARYEANLDPHPHLVCVGCQKIVDLDVDFLQEIPLPDRLHEHVILGHAVWIKGLCPECQKT